jgi:hypothetical protein
MFALDERIAKLRKEKIEKIRHGICATDMDVLRQIAEQLSAAEIAMILYFVYSDNDHSFMIDQIINKSVHELADLQASMEVLNERIL